MKTVRYHSYGDSDVLVHEEADRPMAGPRQVVLRVAGTAFNPLDVAIRAGSCNRRSRWPSRTCRTTTWPASSPRSARG
jgi:NADPH:quinone reductase-like Zn-dependent oxidoreductase